MEADMSEKRKVAVLVVAAGVWIVFLAVWMFFELQKLNVGG
jgi:hypothetical protein